MTALLREFDVGRDVLARDLADLLAGLEKRGLIKITR